MILLLPEIDMFVIANGWPQAFALAVHRHFHVGRAELRAHVVPRAVGYGYVAAQLKNTVSLKCKIQAVVEVYASAGWLIF